MTVEAEEAHNSVKRRLAEPAGRVRFSCPVALGQHVVADLLPQFMQVCPKVQIVQRLGDNVIDPVDEGFDLALHVHSRPLEDSSLVQRAVGRIQLILTASPAYFERRDRPHEPEDLREAAGMARNAGMDGANWHLEHEDGRTADVPFKPVLASNDWLTLRKMAEAGLGIAAVPAHLVRHELARGTLERVLPDWRAAHASLTILMPSRRGTLPSVRAFVEFLLRELPPLLGGRLDEKSVKSADRPGSLASGPASKADVTAIHLGCLSPDSSVLPPVNWGGAPPRRFTYWYLLRIEIARFTPLKRNPDRTRLSCSDAHLTVDRCYLLRCPVQSDIPPVPRSPDCTSGGLAGLATLFAVPPSFAWSTQAIGHDQTLRNQAHARRGGATRSHAAPGGPAALGPGRGRDARIEVFKRASMPARRSSPRCTSSTSRSRTQVAKLKCSPGSRTTRKLRPRPTWSGALRANPIALADAAGGRGLRAVWNLRGPGAGPNGPATHRAGARQAGARAHQGHLGLWRKNVLNPESNVQFGEGGAGTFSDGKLYSQIKDPRHLGRKVMNEFVKAGAPAEILYVAHPHIGTFKLVKVVENMREQIIAMGGEIRFESASLTS